MPLIWQPLRAGLKAMPCMCGTLCAKGGNWAQLSKGKYLLIMAMKKNSHNRDMRQQLLEVIK